MMDAQIESRLLGLLGIAIGIFGVAAQYRWHKIPGWLSGGAILLAIVILAYAGWTAVPTKLKEKTPRLYAGLTICVGAALFLIGTRLLFVHSNTRQATSAPPHLREGGIASTPRLTQEINPRTPSAHNGKAPHPQRLPPILNVFLVPTPSDPKMSSYGITWSPEPQSFGLKVTDFFAPPQGSGLERPMTVYVQNTGPGAARLIKIVWRFEDGNLAHEIKTSDIFGRYLTLLTQDSLRVENGGAWSVIPFGSQGTIQLTALMQGEMAEVSFPLRVQDAVALFCLTRSKVMLDAEQTNPGAPYAEPLAPLSLLVEFYDDSGDKYEKKYRIDGRIMSSSGQPIKDGKTWRLPQDSRGAGIDHLSITSDSEPPRAVGAT